MVTKTSLNSVRKYVFLPVMIRLIPPQAAAGFSSATPALTPLMLDEASGKLVVWDGQKAGSAVGILVLPLEGTETVLTYYKSGTFATEAIRWPESVDEHKKANAFAGSALSHAALP